MNELKYLSFTHIKGFNELTDSSKDLFIDLYKYYLSRRSLDKRGDFSETNIKSVYISPNNDFWTTFSNGRTYTFINNDSSIETHVNVYVPADNPRITIKTTKESIEQLKTVIRYNKDIHSMSVDIINVMYRVIKKLTLSIYRKRHVSY